MAIITVSRGIFSGARELAQGISQELGYKLVSREDIIEKTASYGVSEETLDYARRRKLGLLQRRDIGWVHYRVYALAALANEIRQGRLLYLGGNGRALLRDFPNVLNVKVDADLEHRIKNLIKRTDYVIDRKQAKRIIEEIDEKKAKWHRTLHREGLLDPSEYDLVIEPGITSVSEACQLISVTLDQPQFQTSHKSLETIDLLTAAADLRATIAMKREIQDNNVNVEVREGMIVIKGSVRSAEDMNGIKELLEWLPEDQAAEAQFDKQTG